MLSVRFVLSTLARAVSNMLPCAHPEVWIWRCSFSSRFVVGCCVLTTTVWRSGWYSTFVMGLLGGGEEVLIFKEADSEVFGIVADGHLRDDFAAVEVDGERLLFDDGEGGGVVVVVGRGEGTGEGGIVGVGKEGGGHGRRHGASVANKQRDSYRQKGAC